MICTIPSCDNLAERSGVCASHAYTLRKAEKTAKREAEKKAQKQKPIAKVGTKNTFECSDGTRVTQAEINKLLSESHVKIFATEFAGRSMQLPRECEGCGTRCSSTAHIIPKARCKVIRKTELIWSIENQFPACFECNAAIENPKGQEWKKLKNVEKCMKFIMTHDPELYIKFQLNAAIREEQPKGELKGFSGFKDFIEPHKI